MPPSEETRLTTIQLAEKCQEAKSHHPGRNKRGPAATDDCKLHTACKECQSRVTLNRTAATLEYLKRTLHEAVLGFESYDMYTEDFYEHRDKAIDENWNKLNTITFRDMDKIDKLVSTYCRAPDDARDRAKDLSHRIKLFVETVRKIETHGTKKEKTSLSKTLNAYCLQNSDCSGFENECTKPTCLVELVKKSFERHLRSNVYDREKEIDKYYADIDKMKRSPPWDDSEFYEQRDQMYKNQFAKTRDGWFPDNDYDFD
jgi:hypothetical protein